MASVRQFGLLSGAPEPPRIHHRARYARASGYAAPPGTGPEGETCGTCAHCRIRAIGKHRRVYKCALMINAWNGDRATDVLKRSPACAKFAHGQPRSTTTRIGGHQ